MSGVGQQYYGNDAQPSPQPQMAPGALTQAYQNGVYPQGMGYLNPLQGLMTPQVANNLANVGADLTSNPQEISGALARAQTTRDAATQDKAAAITRAINVLQNMPNYDQQIAGAAKSAGFGAPSRTGFSESFANANRGLQGALVGNRQFDSENAMQVAKLGLMKAGLPEDAAEATLGDVEKKFDIGAKFSQDAALAQYRENLVNARNNAALLGYQGKLATSGLGMGLGTNGLSGVLPNDFATKIAGLENNTGNPAAQNPNSSAMGNGQFLNGTWLPLIKQARPDLASNMSDDQLLALRANPQISQQMIVENAKRNAQLFDQVGLPSNMTTLALAHRFGPQVAVAMLHSPDNTPIASLVGQDVITANPTIAHQTVGQYIDNLQQQAGDTPVTTDGNTLSVQTTGDEYLKSLPPYQARMVGALLKGDMPVTSYALTKPPMRALVNDALQVDPNFNPADYDIRKGTRQWITKGPGAQTVTALNTALGHAAGLQDTFDKLGNTSLPAVNAAVNFGKTQLGNSAPIVAQENVGALASEARKVFAASGGGNLTELENWEKNFPINGSPEQQKGALQEFVNLLDSRLSAVGDQYSRGMGKTEDPLNLLSPVGRAAYTKLTGRQPESGTVSGQAQPAGGSNVPTPQDIVNELRRRGVVK